MKLFAIIKKITTKQQKPAKRMDIAYESFIKQGREQFKLLLKKGLGVPVVLL